MSTTSYKKYVEDTIILTRSLVIKSEAVALAMNSYLNDVGLPVSTDKNTWKYYLNLAGIPHETDKEIYIASLDTKEPIVFNKESLVLHPVTKDYYRSHTGYFKQLIAQYPEQEVLIRGIINPIPLDVSINAEDFSILGWDEEYVEPQESNVIYELGQIIYKFKERWNNPAYLLTDDVYLPGFLSVMYSSIPGWLMGIRLANAKTYQANSFHIKEYLRSHGKYDKYYSYLSIEQVFFLYRNLLYIQNNVGKTNTFEWLVENLLTKRGIGLSEYNIKLGLVNLNDSGSKELEFHRENINLTNGDSTNRVLDFSKTLELEQGVAVGNESYELQTLDDNTYLMSHGKTDSYKTKMVESIAKDLTDAGPVSFSKELLKYWGYWSLTGRYDAVFNFIEPSKGTEIALNAKEAFIMFIYSFHKSLGIDLIDVPKARFEHVRTTKVVEKESILNIVPQNSVSNEVIDYALGKRHFNTAIPFNYTFVYQVSNIFEMFNNERKICANIQHFRERGYTENLFNMFYESHEIDMVDEPTTYEQWLESLFLDFSDVDVLEHASFARSLLETFVGNEFYKDISMKGIQEALVSILESLSSYHVQYLTEVNELSIPFWDRIDIRLGDVTRRYMHKLGLNFPPSIIQKVNNKSTSLVKLDANKPDIRVSYERLRGQKVSWLVNDNVLVRESNRTKVRLPISKTFVREVVNVTP